MPRDVGSGRELPPDSLAYSVEEAAQIVGIGRTLVWQLVRRREIPSARVAGLAQRR
jgi:excisionase family DNA binding protein